MSQNPDSTLPADQGASAGDQGASAGDHANRGYPPPAGGSHPAAPQPPPPAPSPQGQPGAGQPSWASGQPVPPASSGSVPRPRSGDEERTVAVLAHISPIIAAVLSVGWLTILGPLVIWAVYKDRNALIRQAAAGAFNFTLVIWAAVIAGWVCLFTIVLFPLALLLWVAAAVAGLVFHIQGAVKAGRGEPYQYPLSIPVLS